MPASGDPRLLSHNMLPVPWGVRLRVGIGEPLARGAGEDRDALIGRVRDEIGAMLERWRSDHARGST